MKEEIITQGKIETFPEFPAQALLPESEGDLAAVVGSGETGAGIVVSGEISPGLCIGVDGYGGDLSSEVRLHADMAAGDVLLPYTMPRAEYMCGCTATAVGMLLGYYDLYGYRAGGVSYDMSNLIEGTISVDSRGSDGGSIYDMTDPSALATFIASDEYKSRFYGTSSEEELPYTYVGGDPAQGLNVSVWNCLADYLGTGQYWRGNGDLSTTHYYASLNWLNTTKLTLLLEGLSVPARYLDFKYGLSLYVQSRGCELDPARTESFSIDSFTFSDFMAEIDAGRPVLLSMESAYSGHSVLAYGYNAATQEVIFDDTYRSGCRMTWTGSYDYADEDFSLDGATTIVFDTAGLPAFSDTEVVAGGFSGGASTEVLKHNPDGTLAIFNTQTGISTPVGDLARPRWAVKGAGDYSHTGSTEVLMQNLQTGDVYLVGDAASGITEESVTESVRLGILSPGYELGGVGNFNGSTHPGVLLTAPEQVSPGYSKVTGLACWTLDDVFNMSPGWLGAMVTTWDGDAFTIDPADLAGADDAAINAKYYSFELIGTGDFNGDGRDDVMIRNNMPKTAEGRNVTGSGDVFVFLTGDDITGYQSVNVAYTGCAADPWRLAGVGDLNGDGIQDAILENTEDGGIASWILDASAQYVDAKGIGVLSAGQSFAGVGDVNGDYIDDVLFTDASGNLFAWTVENGAGTGLIALG